MPLLLEIFTLKQTPDRIALPQNTNWPRFAVSQELLCPNEKPFDALNATSNKANPPPRKPVNLFAKKWTTFARVFMVPGPPNKRSPLDSPRLAAPASIFLRLPAVNHHPLALRKDDPLSNLPANAPIPHSAHCVARVLPQHLPPRSLALLRLALANAGPQAAVAPPQKLLKPARAIAQSAVVNQPSDPGSATWLRSSTRGGFAPSSCQVYCSPRENPCVKGFPFSVSDFLVHQFINLSKCQSR